ncbi:universal stress protein [Chelatococcus sambhunathii]|uniref:Universal stress protein n=1 Tax=Chelatococcus sambhunathii TaxID=363953 RepID=A0ABU1DGP3_9HYPH|nr:universal stress protein [Chelatococcus sambhunathii]
MPPSAVAVIDVEVQRAQPPYERILVPTDGSALSQEAVFEALKLASSTGASVVFLTVVEPFQPLTISTDMLESSRKEYERYAEAHAENLLGQACGWAEDAGVPYFAVRKWADQPHEEIIGVARERNCDLIAMASHGRRGLAAIVLGSVTQKVLTHSDIPVLVLRRPPAAATQPGTSNVEAGRPGAGIG